MKKYTDIKNTPAYILDEDLLIKNLEILKGVIDRTGAHILLAQKAFSMYSEYSLIAKYISGTTASGLYEAKLGHEEMGNKEVHVFSPAYKKEDIDEILSISDHVVFNSLNQWNIYKEKALKSGVSCGIRVNPKYSEIETDIYNPCVTGSRLGCDIENIDIKELDGIEGLHFHTMCEQGADVLWRTVNVVDKKYGKFLKHMKWINFGGGHHITKEGYDIVLLEKSIRLFQDKYNIEVYLEPGEAIALNAGVLVASVLDIVENGMYIAILDTSAACHMPDVIEMPYRPKIVDAYNPNEKKYTYRLAGPTCLAGDIIGDYSFDNKLKIGDKIVLLDMAIYSMVKNNTFNGMPLPDIVKYNEKSGYTLIKHFLYEDFKNRL